MDTGPFKRPGRPIHSATSDHGESERVLYSDTPPGRYRHCLVILGTISCNPCLVSNAEKLREETYVTVYENKIESSRPCQCWCCGFDRVDVIYFDRAETAAADKASCCWPLFTHCRFCPTCCDAFGEGVILYGGDMCSQRQSCTMSSCNGICFLCHCKMLWPVRNAKELASVIKAARTRSMETMNRHRKLRSGFTREGHMSIGISPSESVLLSDASSKISGDRKSQKSNRSQKSQKSNKSRMSNRSASSRSLPNDDVASVRSARSARSTDTAGRHRGMGNVDSESDSDEESEFTEREDEVEPRTSLRRSKRVNVEELSPRRSLRLDENRNSLNRLSSRTSSLRRGNKPQGFVAVAQPAPTFDYPAYAEDMLR